jgi:uncharacterized protein (UPF0332 family)
LDTANLNYEKGQYKTANNRSYYSIFHALRALLVLDGVDFRPHNQLISYFNKNYIRTGRFGPSLSETVRFASRLRTSSDYSDFYIATKVESEKALEGAREVLFAVETYLAGKLNEKNASDGQDIPC